MIRIKFQKGRNFGRKRREDYEEISKCFIIGSCRRHDVVLNSMRQQSTRHGDLSSGNHDCNRKKTSEAAESTGEKTADGKQYKIGVLQLVQHAALDASNKGFIQALDDAGLNYTVDQQNASGDQPTCQTIASKLVNDNDDLILAIATPAAQAVAGATSDIPILLTAVTDPASSDLVESNDNPGGNVSGTSDLTPVKEQIALLKKRFSLMQKPWVFFSALQNPTLKSRLRWQKMQLKRKA